MTAFEWIMVATIATTTAGSIAFGLVAARNEKSDEIASLLEEVERQRSKKKFWKAKAKSSHSSLQSTRQLAFPSSSKSAS